MTDDNSQQQKLLELVHHALQQVCDLREKYNIGDKFRFIRDRLQALFSRVDENIIQSQSINEQTNHEMSADEKLVYVYLYNTQGILLKTWMKMLNPKVFYEYSVNRPIYAEKSQIESFIRNKPNKSQHAYLTIVVKANDIVKTTEAEPLKDAIGNPLIKVKEGSLHVERLISFTYDKHDYKLCENGELVRILSS